MLFVKTQQDHSPVLANLVSVVMEKVAQVLPGFKISVNKLFYFGKFKHNNGGTQLSSNSKTIIFNLLSQIIVSRVVI